MLVNIIMIVVGIVFSCIFVGLLILLLFVHCLNISVQRNEANSNIRGGGQMKVTVFMIIVGIIFLMYLCWFAYPLLFVSFSNIYQYPFKRCTAGKIRSEGNRWVKHSKYTEHSAK